MTSSLITGTHRKIQNGTVTPFYGRPKNIGYKGIPNIRWHEDILVYTPPNKKKNEEFYSQLEVLLLFGFEKIYKSIKSLKREEIIIYSRKTSHISIFQSPVGRVIDIVIALDGMTVGILGREKIAVMDVEI